MCTGIPTHWGGVGWGGVGGGGGWKLLLHSLCSLDNEGLLLKERICFMGRKFFISIADPHGERSQK